MPRSRNWRMRLSTSATWRTEMAAVGSSISTILASRQHGAGDRHRLPLAARHLLDEVARPGLGLQFLEDLAGAPVHRGIVEDAERPDAAAQLAAEKDVGGRGQIVAERQVLVDDLDAVPARLDRPVQHDLLAVHAHRAVARPEVAGDHLDQRRLAGAVVAHQADDLAGLERQRNVVDRLDGAEMFRNVGEFENRHPSYLRPALTLIHRSNRERGCHAISLVGFSSRAERRDGFMQTPKRASIECQPNQIYDRHGCHTSTRATNSLQPKNLFCQTK